MSIYEEIIAAGCEIDHHYSDLYVKDCPKAREILGQHKQSFTSFVCEIDGKIWLDIPFQFLPYWEERKRVAECRRAAAKARQ